MKKFRILAIPFAAACALAGSALAQDYQEAPELSALVADGQAGYVAP